jgi:hypothetical protein
MLQQFIADYWIWLLIGAVVLGGGFGVTFVYFSSSHAIATTLTNLLLGAVVGAAGLGAAGYGVALFLGGGDGAEAGAGAAVGPVSGAVRASLRGDVDDTGTWRLEITKASSGKAPVTVWQGDCRGEGGRPLALARRGLEELAESGGPGEVIVLALEMPDAPPVARDAVLAYAEELGMRRTDLAPPPTSPAEPSP